MSHITRFWRWLLGKPAPENNVFLRPLGQEEHLARDDWMLFSGSLAKAAFENYSRPLTDGEKAARFFGCAFGSKDQRDLAVRFYKRLDIQNRT